MPLISRDCARACGTVHFLILPMISDLMRVLEQQRTGVTLVNVWPQGFCEDIGNVRVSRDMTKAEQTSSNTFANLMVCDSVVFLLESG